MVATVPGAGGPLPGLQLGEGGEGGPYLTYLLTCPRPAPLPGATIPQAEDFYKASDG